jgi:hypothetical protein
MRIERVHFVQTLKENTRKTFKHFLTVNAELLMLSNIREKSLLFLFGSEHCLGFCLNNGYKEVFNLQKNNSFGFTNNRRCFHFSKDDYEVNMAD